VAYFTPTEFLATYFIACYKYCSPTDLKNLTQTASKKIIAVKQYDATNLNDLYSMNALALASIEKEYSIELFTKAIL
jgi:hypothetical protein